ncbi:hypothetical protein HHL11_24260 [Ramlibacter sp. G-1-2-2]|uniref:PglD N-terminal domain-containing protein n=1 Tax=Ramlibacter agri TaxID=2728837 RepID=A0A848HBU8_9BURK|nr:NeuD/PglB/VioB family sugar acetyltransferase [Ramlibacter agri]NML46881.1 hypothetical protein [Ramlibacter agri]
MKIVLVGGGGHCLACADVIAAAGREAAGVLDAREGTAPAGLAWLGDDRWMASPEAAAMEFIVTVGQTGSADLRRRLFERILAAGRPLATVRSPHAVIGREAQLGAGSIAMHRAVLNANARVGRNCIVNTGAIVEHDAVVADHCHVSTGAILNGGVIVEEGVLVGSGAVVLQGLRIGAGAIIGAGAVVTHDLPAGTWVGVPARRQA